MDDITLDADRSRMWRHVVLAGILAMFGGLFVLVGVAMHVDSKLRLVFYVVGATVILYGLWQIILVTNIYCSKVVSGNGRMLFQTRIGSEAILWGQVRSIEVKVRQSFVKSDRTELEVEVIPKDSSTRSLVIPCYVFSRKDEEVLLGYLKRQTSARDLKMTMPPRRRETHTP